MAAFNFRLHDAVLDQLKAVIEEETGHLLAQRHAAEGEYRYRIGRISGLADAIEVAEATRKRLVKE